MKYIKHESEMTNEELLQRKNELLKEANEADTDELYYFVKEEIRLVHKEMNKRELAS